MRIFLNAFKLDLAYKVKEIEDVVGVAIPYKHPNLVYVCICYSQLWEPGITGNA